MDKTGDTGSTLRKGGPFTFKNPFEFVPGGIGVNERRKTLQEFRQDFFEHQQEIDSYREEYHSGNIEEIHEKAETVHEEQCSRETAGMADIGTESGERLYSLVRKKQPKVVVETGVANGFSTAVILSALEKNGSGKLISIDFPFKEDSESGITSVADGNGDEILDQFDAQTEKQIVLPSHKQPGWIVPEELRDNWELRLGRSQTLLPQLFCEEREVDLFIHDSDHRVPCQMFEYELSWEHLSGDGVLLSHDIHQPWEQFAEVRNHSKKGRLFPGFGYLAA